MRLAERRYKAVDPDNRTVARTVEREWNDKLEELARLEGQYEDVRQREKVELTDEDRKQVLTLARDLPRVWNAPPTTHVERKNLLRMLTRSFSTIVTSTQREYLSREAKKWMRLDVPSMNRTSTSPKSCCENSPGRPSKRTTGRTGFGRSPATSA
ncbi:MAG: hypothetical protein A2V77_23860 [Anaeromyxobacter sp. RBG_16_69_14]|nr:MAG: hypothetical protein A2V77_23860 [Anaeromyxobacter sp. RBG_16_69_14]